MEVIKNQFDSGKLVKEIRKITNLKQSEMAKKIGKSRESVARVETNKQEMLLSNFLNMLKINGLNIIIFKEDNNA